jgi:hypothetical protein
MPNPTSFKDPGTCLTRKRPLVQSTTAHQVPGHVAQLATRSGRSARSRATSTTPRTDQAAAGCPAPGRASSRLLRIARHGALISVTATADKSCDVCSHRRLSALRPQWLAREAHLARGVCVGRAAAHREAEGVATLSGQLNGSASDLAARAHREPHDQR